MTETVLCVEQLVAHLGSAEDPVRAVDGIGFDIKQGQTFALLGESGCGKTMAALALMRLLPAAGRIVGGSVKFLDRDLLRLPEARMRDVRGAGMSMIFQEPMTSLNPVLRVGQQIVESLQAHHARQGKTAREEALDLLDAVGIPGPELVFEYFPHQISGGMKQRVVIAMALANAPKLLIADEPTTALDVTIQSQVLDLIKEIQLRQGMAVLLISHDLGVVNELADRVAVMYAGQIVENASREAFFSDPQHPYSEKLFQSLPGIGKRDRALDVIQGTVPSLQSRFEGCRFFSRCHRALDLCSTQQPVWSGIENRRVFCHLYGPHGKPRRDRLRQPQPKEIVEQSTAVEEPEGLLRVRGLKIHFPTKSGLFRRVTGYIRAVDGVDLEIKKGKTLAVVGESGCGKTTTGKAILQLMKPSEGSVVFDGQDLAGIGAASLRQKRSDFQIIFQDPYASMNPRMLVSDIITEGLRASGSEPASMSRAAYIEDLLQQVGLPADSANRYPHEFSGGQRQRISIARALAVRPRLIVCDEPTSALDLSVQAQILNLLKELQRQKGISYLFITHNISVVAYLAHHVAVMYLGRIVEHGPVDRIFADPKHPYTRALLSAVPAMEPGGRSNTLRLSGDVPSPAAPPSGCFFHPRCSQAMPMCHDMYPPTFTVADHHVSACHLYHQPD